MYKYIKYKCMLVNFVMDDNNATPSNTVRSNIKLIRFLATTFSLFYLLLFDPASELHCVTCHSRTEAPNDWHTTRPHCEACSHFGQFLHAEQFGSVWGLVPLYSGFVVVWIPVIVSFMWTLGFQNDNDMKPSVSLIQFNILV